MNKSQLGEGRAVVSHRGRVASVPLLRNPGLSLVLAPGSFRRTLMGYVEGPAGDAVVSFEAVRRHCCVHVDEFDVEVAEVTVGSAMFRVEAVHLPVLRRVLRC